MKSLQPDTLIRNPNGAPIIATVAVNCSAARLWQLVGQFAAFDAFIPEISHTEMTGAGVGALRTKHFHDGHRVVEQLNSRDDHTMQMTWTTIYNSLGIARLWAAIRVEALDVECSRVTWTIIAEPEDVTQVGFEQFVQGFANSALENARRLLG